MTDSKTPPQSKIALTADPCQLDDERLEHAVFMEIMALHPTHPTVAELHQALSYSRGELGSPDIEDSLAALRRYGLVRENGEVLEPTLAALHATEVIQRV